MATVVEICNQALANIGIGAYIDSLSEQSEEAEQCNLHYPLARDYVLAAEHWSFAKKYVALAEVASTTNTIHDNWDYQYRYPSDCLRILRLVTDGSRVPSVSIPYEVQLDDSDKRIIYTDQEDATIEYISRVTDPTLFSQHFADAVAANLGWRIAMPLTKNPEIRTEAFSVFQFAMNQAMERNQNEHQDDARRTTEFVEDRLN